MHNMGVPLLVAALYLAVIYWGGATQETATTTAFYQRPNEYAPGCVSAVVPASLGVVDSLDGFREWLDGD